MPGSHVAAKPQIKKKRTKAQKPRNRQTSAQLCWQGESWDYQVIHSQRRTLAVQVYRDGRLVVRAPLGLALDWVERWMESKKEWVARKRVQLQQRSPQRVALSYHAGAQHQLLGRTFQLHAYAGRGRAIFANDQLELPCRSLAQADVISALQRWYRRQSEVIFSQRLEFCWPVFAALGLTYPSALRIRQMKTLWGSMNRKGVMTLNLKLIRAPEEIIDYVIHHELCHLRYYHHGAEFHAMMSQVLPDWRQRKKALEALAL